MHKNIINFLLYHFKTFGFFHGVRKILLTSVYKRLKDIFIADYVYAKSSYFYVKKFYKKNKDIEIKVTKPVNDIGGNEFIYWTCWLQGIDKAPDLVKSCIKSAEKIINGCRIIIITYDNLKTYTSLPDYIHDKHKKGYIQAPQFTDIIRTYLLYTYGGLWFDSTVFFTQSVPELLLKENLFFFKSPLNDEYCPVSNWFIIAAKNKNYALYKLLCLLLEYWHTKKTCIDYFIFHYFLQVIIRYDSNAADIFNKIPYFNNQNPHFLQFKYLFSAFDNEIWKNIINISFCHKLTFKIPADKYNKIDNSFYSYITNQIKEINALS